MISVVYLSNGMALIGKLQGEKLKEPIIIRIAPPGMLEFIPLVPKPAKDFIVVNPIAYYEVDDSQIVENYNSAVAEIYKGIKIQKTLGNTIKFPGGNNNGNM